MPIAGPQRYALFVYASNPAFLPAEQAATMFTTPAPYAPALGGNAVSGSVRVLGATDLRGD